MASTFSLSEDELRRVLELSRWQRDPDAEALKDLVMSAVDEARARASGRDRLTGSVSRAHFRSGATLEAALRDLPIDPVLRPAGAPAGFGHPGCLRIGALMLDVVNLRRYLDVFSLPEGDRLLCRIAAMLVTAFPDAQIVRVQGDAFAVVWLPSSGHGVDPADRARLARAQVAALPDVDLRFTVALLDLSLRAPPDARVAAALIEAELERAYLLERMGSGQAVHRRHLELDGYIPGTTGFNAGV